MVINVKFNVDKDKLFNLGLGDNISDLILGELGWLGNSGFSVMEVQTEEV